MKPNPEREPRNLQLEDRQRIIKVLIVEDWPVVREFLIHVLTADPEIHVIGTASSGEEALEAVKRKKPDVITMDINMPGMNGFDATRRIMETDPTPIVLVSGCWDTQEVLTTFRAVEAGALAVLPRPKGVGHPEYESTTRELVQTVKLMSEVKVIKRWPASSSAATVSAVAVRKAKSAAAAIRVVAIGGSTGGPVVFQTILSELPRDFLTPVLIVQHMASGFVRGFTEWLYQSSGFPVHVAADGEPLRGGHGYVAPDGFHMGVDPGGRIALSKSEPEDGLRPSVSYLFRSVAGVYGGDAVAVLLTGMGKDGAHELKLLRGKGAITIVQDRESSVVYGMPGEAIRLDAARYVLPPGRIAAVLASLVHGKPTGSQPDENRPASDLSSKEAETVYDVPKKKREQARRNSHR